MRCDACGEYRLYLQPMVELRCHESRLIAAQALEHTPQNQFPEQLGRYHVQCYERLAEMDERLPSVGSMR